MIIGVANAKPELNVYTVWTSNLLYPGGGYPDSYAASCEYGDTAIGGGYNFDGRSMMFDAIRVDQARVFHHPSPYVPGEMGPGGFELSLFYTLQDQPGLTPRLNIFASCIMGGHYDEE